MFLVRRESELAKLRAQIPPQQRSRAANVANAAAAQGLEERVRSLTASLVTKQNSLETVTADRNALRFQLEKLEIEYRQSVSKLRQQQQLQTPPRPSSYSSSVHVNDTDDAKVAQVPRLFQETPFDTRVARRVKRAYSTLDSLGVRVGVILRHYPIVRIFTIFYVVLLHLWVTLVLCSASVN